MQKRFFGIVVLLAFLSACISAPTNTLGDCEGQNTTGLRDACYYESAVESNDLGLCTQIIGPDLRNECINSVS